MNIHVAFACPDMSSETVIKCLHSLFCLFGTPNLIHSDRGTQFLSKEVQHFLSRNGVAQTYSTPYHPTGNSQVERYNGTIWRTICLALKTNKLPIQQWEKVLSESLNAIRALLCVSTNETLHNLFFKFQRKSNTGESLPTFLCNPGPVLYRKHVKESKYEPSVEQVELIQATQHHALIKHPSGRVDSVSTKDIAPYPDGNEHGNTENTETNNNIELKAELDLR